MSKRIKFGTIEKTDSGTYIYLGKGNTPSGWLNKKYLSERDKEALKRFK